MPIAMLSTSLLTNPQKYGRFNALDTENPFATKPGMVLVSPETIANSGGSASLGANGRVTFSTVTSVSLNGCFTADFDNYMLSISGIVSSNDNYALRLRASGSDASGSDYVRQYLDVSNTVVASGRQTQSNMSVMFAITTRQNATTVLLYGPALAAPTAERDISALAGSGALLSDSAHTHSLSTSYDGFSLFAEAGGGRTITGEVAVYGIRS